MPKGRDDRYHLDSFSLFIERVNELDASPFVERMTRPVKTTLRMATDGSGGITRTGPTLQDIAWTGIWCRPFMSQDERISMRVIGPVLSDLSGRTLIDPLWTQQFDRIRDHLNQYLDDQYRPAGLLRYQLADGTWVDNAGWTHRRLINLFVQGEAAHLSQRNGDELLEWKRRGMADLLRDDVCTALLNVVVRLRSARDNAIAPAEAELRSRFSGSTEDHLGE